MTTPYHARLLAERAERLERMGVVAPPQPAPATPPTEPGAAAADDCRAPSRIEDYSGCASELPRPARRPTAADVAEAAARVFKIRVEEVLGCSHEARVVLPRLVGMYVARLVAAKNSYPEIGRGFGGRHHTTAMSAWRRISRQRSSDEKVQRRVEDILCLLRMRGFVLS